MSTPSAQTIVSKYHFPLEGAKGCLEKLRFQGWSKFVLKDAQLFVCVKINQKLVVTPESKQISKDVYSIHKRKESWEETFSILNGRGWFHKELRKLIAVGLAIVSQFFHWIKLEYIVYSKQTLSLYGYFQSKSDSGQ